MRRFSQLLNKLQKSTWFDVTGIAFFSILAHGLLINWLGFYTDDWTFLWTHSRFGSEGLTNYFSTNRPIWGLFYQLTMPLLGIRPFAWHIFAMVWGMITSLAFYGAVRVIWPNRQRLALLSGILFAVFPGFILQPIAITFGHIYIVYAIFVLSLFCTAKALTVERFSIHWSVTALLLSAINLLSMEYFYTLELIRIGLIIIIRMERQNIRKGLILIIKDWLPYAAVFGIVAIWRIFFFKVQTYNYDLALVESLQQDFLTTVINLGKSILLSLYNAAILSWIQPFTKIIQAVRPTTFFIFLLLLMGFTIVISWLYFWAKEDPNNYDLKRKQSSFASIGLAIAGLLMAGWPFYLTGLAVVPDGFQSRFLLPFIFGAALLLAALIELIPNRIISASIAGLIIGGAVGYHVLTQNDFRYVTLENNRLISQLVARIPGLSAGTTILSDEGSKYFTFTTLTAQLNLIYEPIDDSQVNYGWIFPRDLAGKTLNPILEGENFDIGLVTAIFTGNTNALVSIQQPAGGCLRVLSSGSEMEVPELKEYKAGGLSNPGLILEKDHLNPDINLYYRDLPMDHWCTYYQKAELAVSSQDYPGVMELYKQVLELNLAPFDPSEWIPFIQASTKNGDWSKAFFLTGRIRKSRDGYIPNLCRIWRGISIPGKPDQFLVENTLLKLDCLQPDFLSKE